MDHETRTVLTPNLTELWEGLRCLTKITSHDESQELKDLPEAFQVNLKRALTALGFDDTSKIPRRKNTVLCGSGSIWDFVETALYILVHLKELTVHEDLSVSQQKDIRSCLQFLASLGICPNVLEGITHDNSKNREIFKLLEDRPTPVMQKYERLCVIVNVLLECCNNSNLRPLIISNIMHHILAALFQLCFAPVKKPSRVETLSSSSDKDFYMTTEIWERLQKDRRHFKTMLDKLVRETYQPKLMFELMVLQGNPNDRSAPLWLKKAVSSLLTSCLIQPGGVLALIQASFDSAPDTGNDWKKIDAIAKIISSPVNHYQNIASQIWALLEVSGAYHNEKQIVIVSCIQQMFEKDAAVVKELVLEPLFHPLSKVFSEEVQPMNLGTLILDEKNIDSLVKQMHMCFASSNSKVASVCLPAELLVSYVSFFFCLFCKVNTSASHLCQYCEDILYRIMSDCTQEELHKALKCILVGDAEEGAFLFPRNLIFRFGSSGGVYLETGEEPPLDLLSSNVEDSGNVLMMFLERRNDADLMISVFESLLKILVELGMKPKPLSSNATLLGTIEDTLAALILSSEKHLGVVRLLAVLVENSNVKEKITKSPGCILFFIAKLLESVTLGNSLEEDENLELAFVAFMILNVILDNCNEDSDWSLFTNHLQLVSVIQNRTKNEELRRLAARVHSIITTCGGSEDTARHRVTSLHKTKCEMALEDACDPLLPVRGHALVQLASLIQRRDPETLAKKDAVLCLFKENLKNSDSYIYLAAINGMVAFATVQSDEAVKILTTEYIASTSDGDANYRDPELRMKVGEILVKFVRELGALAPKYRNELLNAFLIGTKDTDHLVRASSLSNIGEVCQILGFRVGPVLRELLLCIHSILQYDKAIEPRRASVMVVTHLLRGLEAGTLVTLEDAALELYRTLKRAYNEDTDEVVRLHAQLALEELGSLAKDFLFPRLPMQKKIQILP